MSDRLVKVALDTVSICKSETYAFGNQAVKIKIEPSVYYPPDFVSEVSFKPGTRKVTVSNETTLEAGYKHKDKHVCMLNFASAKNPGGGFLRGSKAQEEDLACASGLYWTIKDQKEFYDLANRSFPPVYTDAVIYSQNVPVFKDSKYRLLEVPWYGDFITCAAPNLRALEFQNWSGDIRGIFKKRIIQMLSIASIYKPDVLILGAWGCGVFGNDPALVALLFDEALNETCLGLFSEVIFAVPFNTVNLEAFVKQFGRQENA